METSPDLAQQVLENITENRSPKAMCDALGFSMHPAFPRKASGWSAHRWHKVYARIIYHSDPETVYGPPIPIHDILDDDPDDGPPGGGDGPDDGDDRPGKRPRLDVGLGHPGDPSPSASTSSAGIIAVVHEGGKCLDASKITIHSVYAKIRRRYLVEFVTKQMADCYKEQDRYFSLQL